MKLSRKMKNRLLVLYLSCGVLIIYAAFDWTGFRTVSEDMTEAALRYKIYNLVKKYDPDVYTILKQEEEDTDFMDYYDPDNGFAGSLDTTVHETYHGLVANNLYIYVGGNIGYTMDYFNDYCFKTEEMSAEIPEELRTFRYETYVAQGSELTSNQNGVFGLLNEFAAYYWGCRATSSLMDYYSRFGWEETACRNYAVNMGNDVTAYAEFKYWILEYLLYAEHNAPNVYQKLLEDGSFCNAYTAIETQFASLIRENEDNLSDRNDALRSHGQQISWTESKISAGGYYADLSDYALLLEELGKEEYVAMDQTIKNHTSDVNAVATISHTGEVIKSGKSVVLNLNDTETKTIWESSDEKIATVDSKGEVIGRSEGVCTISGSVGKRTFYCTLTVE